MIQKVTPKLKIKSTPDRKWHQFSYKPFSLNKRSDDITTQLPEDDTIIRLFSNDIHNLVMYIVAFLILRTDMISRPGCCTCKALFTHNIFVFLCIWCKVPWQQVFTLYHLHLHQMSKMFSEPILCTFVYITFDAMLNFDVTFEQALTTLVSGN